MPHSYSESGATPSTKDIAQPTPAPYNVSATLSPRRSLAQPLLIVVFAQLALLIWFVRQDPMMMYWIARRFNPPLRAVADKDLTEELRNDPDIGKVMPDVAARIQPLVENAKRDCLVVYVGDCASCLSIDIRAWQSEAAKENISLVMLTAGEQALAKKFSHDLHVTIPIYSDPSKTLIKPLNALWPGRAYLFSKQWQLVWLQRQRVPAYNPFRDPHFLEVFLGAK